MSIKMLYRKITFRCLKLLNLFTSTILGILFSSSCQMNAVAYGMPHADYKVSGTIVSSDHNLPIKNLLVAIKDTFEPYGIHDSTKTDSLGKFSLEYSGPPWDSTFDLNVIDVDSTENGTFSAKDTIFSIPESELKGGNGPWYAGHGEKKIDLKLDKKD